SLRVMPLAREQERAVQNARASHPESFSPAGSEGYDVDRTALLAAERQLSSWWLNGRIQEGMRVEQQDEADGRRRRTRDGTRAHSRAVPRGFSKRRPQLILVLAGLQRNERHLVQRRVSDQTRRKRRRRRQSQTPHAIECSYSIGWTAERLAHRDARLV